MPGVSAFSSAVLGFLMLYIW